MHPGNYTIHTLPVSAAHVHSKVCILTVAMKRYGRYKFLFKVETQTQDENMKKKNKRGGGKFWSNSCQFVIATRFFHADSFVNGCIRKFI